MPPAPRIERWLSPLLAAASLLAIGLWLFLAWRQVQSPMELFSQEGGIVDHIRRAAQGKPVYVAPGLDFVPLLYTPVYYWLCAAFAWAGDLAFVVPRAVSALATIGAMACVAAMVWRANRSIVWALASAGTFALGAGRVQAWYALAQVDSLFMLLLALAVLVAQNARLARHYFVVGLIFALAFWCKQSGLVAAALFAATMLAVSWRFAAATLAGLALGILPLLAWLALASDGWFLFYAFKVPMFYGEDWSKLLVVVIHDMPRLLPAYALGLAAIGLLWRGQDRIAAVKWLATAIALGGTALAGRLHLGGHVNTLIPAVWLTALALGVGGGVLSRALAAGLLDRRWAVALWTIVTLQYLGLAYDPRPFLPASNGAAVTAEIKAGLEQAGRPLLLPGLGYLTGEVAGADPAAVIDLLNVDPMRGRRLLEELALAIRDKRYAAIVIDDYSCNRYASYYEAYYRRAGLLASDVEAQLPRAGIDFGPLCLLVPR